MQPFSSTSERCLPRKSFGACSASSLLDRSEQLRATGDKNDLAAGAVLGLRQHIGGDKIGPRRVVGDHGDFARAGQLIDGHGPDDLALGLDHEGVAGAENFLHARDAVGAVSQRGDGLRPAHLVNLRRARPCAGHRSASH